MVRSLRRPRLIRTKNQCVMVNYATGYVIQSLIRNSGIFPEPVHPDAFQGRRRRGGGQILPGRNFFFKNCHMLQHVSAKKPSFRPKTPIFRPKNQLFDPKNRFFDQTKSTFTFFETFARGKRAIFSGGGGGNSPIAPRPLGTRLSSPIVSKF